jgi:hypothetical protein
MPAEFIAIRRDVDWLSLIESDMDSLRKHCEMNLRRCATRQHDLDTRKQLPAQQSQSGVTPKRR